MENDKKNHFLLNIKFPELINDNYVFKLKNGRQSIVSKEDMEKQAQTENKSLEAYLYELTVSVEYLNIKGLNQEKIKKIQGDRHWEKTDPHEFTDEDLELLFIDPFGKIVRQILNRQNLSAISMMDISEIILTLPTLANLLDQSFHNRVISLRDDIKEALDSVYTNGFSENLREWGESQIEKSRIIAESYRKKAEELEAKARDAEAEAEKLRKELINQRLAQTDGSKLYHMTQRVISKGLNSFNIQDDHAVADMTKLVGNPSYLIVNPQNEEITAEYVTSMLETLNDESADILDILYHEWISSNPKHHNEDIIIHVDQILESRGRLKQKSGSGRRGGYDRATREDVKAHLKALESLEIRGKRHSYSQKKEVPYTSRIIAIMDTEGDYAYRIVPGTVFAMGLLGLDGSRQVSKISERIIQYDPYRQQWEKRIGRYFSWLWRAGQKESKGLNSIRVSTLLEVIGGGKRRPAETREALEKALDNLVQDSVIKQWHYSPDSDENQLSVKEWYPIYLDWKIQVFIPDSIMSAYAQIKPKKQKALKTGSKTKPKENPKLKSAADRLQVIMQRDGLSVRQAADQIGISKSSIDRILNGSIPSKTNAIKIETWILKKG